jgi:Ran GTPase-activating protein (RanGAP) involved in mRNA processing and transport
MHPAHTCRCPSRRSAAKQAAKRSDSFEALRVLVRWSAADVGHAVATLGPEAFKQYRAIAEAHGIDGAALLTIKGSSLRALGVRLATHRRRLLARLQPAQEAARTLRLAALRESSPGLRHLSLQGAGVGTAGAGLLADAIAANRTLTSLHLGSNGVGSAGAALVAAALGTNRTLAKLVLAKNGIGARGAQAVASALGTNRTLTSLDLTDNGAGDLGASAMAVALCAGGVALRTLTLASNAVGPTGAALLADALKVNTSLTVLQLVSNGVHDTGAAALAEALKLNTTLTSLHLGNNGVGDAGGNAFARALQCTSGNSGNALVTLDLASGLRQRGKSRRRNKAGRPDQA